MTIAQADMLIREAVENQVAPAAQLLVAHRNKIIHHEAYGQTPKGKTTLETVFDLASLTKALATTSALAILLDKNEFEVDDKIGKFLPQWKESQISIRHLLQHSSGLPAWKPYFETLKNEDSPKSGIYDAIANEKLLSVPGEKVLYSDLDFMVLGQLIEKLSGTGLDEFVEETIFKPHEIKLFFMPLNSEASVTRLAQNEFAPTENCDYRGLISGFVHDDNCYFAGGVMGHAGLFGSAGEVYKLTGLWEEAIDKGGFVSQKTARRFVFPNHTPRGASFVWGFDRPTWKTSTASRYISAHSIGHLGFTGTSFWLDFDQQVSVVLLTNRVHPTRDKNSEEIKELRIKVHEAIFKSLGLTGKGPFCKLPATKEVKHIHLTAIAGTGMGSLAGMLKTAGYRVTGSDQAIYPPMSTLLEKQNIPVSQPFAAENLKNKPDMVVVGNVCTRDHVEVVEIRKNNLAYDSFSGTLEKFFLAGKKPLVVSGTHGKTTSSSMMSWLLEDAGYDPGFMIGGLVQNFESNYKLGKGEYFVIEGDEYDSAYFDKYSKFLHYRPFGAIITSIEFDHADIFDSIEEIEEQFEYFVKLIPPEGCLVACWDYETVRKVTSLAKCNVLSYGTHPEAKWKAEILEENENGSVFKITNGEKEVVSVELPMSGLHNISNALAVTALLSHFGYPMKEINKAFKSFKGIARRQQVRGVEKGIRIIDDFAHHPTAVKLTLDGLKKRYSSGKLLVAFDPRTNTSSRNIFQKEFAESFKAADMVWIGDPSRMDRIAPELRMDVEKLARDIETAGQSGKHISDVDEMARDIAKMAKSGDTIAVLSNGSFSGLHEKLLEILAK